MTIRNPVEWTSDKLGLGDRGVRREPGYAWQNKASQESRPITIEVVGLHDLRDAFAKGVKDFGENRTDVAFLCLFYPIFGIVLARLASGGEMLPLLFPLVSGFSLLGPVAGVGLYEISRQRELGLKRGWIAAFDVVRSPAFGSVIGLGLILFVIYAAWLLTAWGIYTITLGPQPPVSVGSFVHDVVTTKAGWAMTVIGVGVGFLYACIVLALTIVSFPVLLDRNVGVGRAIAASVQVVRVNPGPMAAWGLIVALGLLIGSIPLFFGLVLILPVLGHATWHLYRKVVT